MSADQWNMIQYAFRSKVRDRLEIPNDPDAAMALIRTRLEDLDAYAQMLQELGQESDAQRLRTAHNVLSRQSRDASFDKSLREGIIMEIARFRDEQRQSEEVRDRLMLTMGLARDCSEIFMNRMRFDDDEACQRIAETCKRLIGEGSRDQDQADHLYGVIRKKYCAAKTISLGIKAGVSSRMHGPSDYDKIR